MEKFKSLLKAMLSQDMNIFAYKAKHNSSKVIKVLFPAIIGIVVMLAVGSYAYMFAEPLAELGLTYIMLTLFLVIVTAVTFVEGMYKSQGILFDSKDNELLFSLPVKKSSIFFLRIVKLLIFQFVYNLVFILPSLVVYIYFENPSVSFYLVSFVMLFLLPIIPTILACIVGYVIKGASTKFKAKKVAQTIISIIFCMGIFYLSYNLQGLITSLTENATSINDALTKVYYPIGAYINLIQEFNWVEFLKLIAVNIIPLILVVYIGSISYFKIISKSGETGTAHKKITKDKSLKTSSPLKSLIKKEIARYFSSPVYILNTSIGIFIMLFASIALCVNSDALIEMIVTGQGIDIDANLIYDYLPKIFLQLIIFVGCMTSITSSSISLEGKSFNITKSLPVKTEKIFLSKLLTSSILTLPLMILSSIIFCIKFNVGVMEFITILTFSIIVPTFTALMGLVINLKYPKMDASSDTEVVKQSMSSMISVWLGFAIFGVSSALMIFLFEMANTLIVIELCVLIIAIIVLWNVLKKYGKKRFREINI